MIQHRHLLIRAEVEKPPAENEIVNVEDWMGNLVSVMGMKLLSGPHVKYCRMNGNRGMTGVCIIETSHIACHIWDEKNPALVQLDVYSCSTLKPSLVFAALNQFDPVRIEYKFLDREHNLKIMEEDSWVLR